MTKLKLICALLIFSIVFSLIGDSVVMVATALPAEKTSISTVEKKVYSTATLEDTFDDRHVLVVMSNVASLANLDYSAEDFPEVDCKNIKNMMQSTTDIIEAKLSGKLIENRSSSSEYVTFGDYYDVNTADFHQIIAIELADPGKENVLAAIKQLEQRTDVLSVSPNYIYSLESEAVTTRQLYVNEPWDPLYEDQWAIDLISLPDAWDITVGHNRTVVVGVVDTGVDYSHPDLEHIVNDDDSREIDTDGNRYPATSNDLQGHGTMIAGIIGAHSFNSEGIAGVNWGVEIVSLRVTVDGYHTSTMAMIEAIEIAQEQGIPILNISMARGSDMDAVCLVNAIQQYSGLVVCSAGNDGENLDNLLDQYPRDADSDNIIVVGACTSYDTPWNRSNFHPTKVDLFAPGAPVLSCFPMALCDAGCSLGYHQERGYHHDAGTSYAAPYVAGVASLLLSMYSDQIMSPEALIYHLKFGVDTSSAYQGKCETGGRLNAYKVLSWHSFTNTYDYYNSTYHKAYCICSGYRFERHTWINTGDMEICSGCGYMGG